MRRVYEAQGGRITETTQDQGHILVFIGPTDTEKRYLIDELKVDEHTLQSALDPDELSRLEFEPDHVAIIFKLPTSHSAKEMLVFRVASAGAFLFKDRLVIVMADDIPLFDMANKQFAKYQSLPGIMLGLLYRSILHFQGHLRAINTISDELEQKVSSSLENRSLMGLFSLEKSLVYYLNAVNSNGMLIEKIRNNVAKIGFSNDEQELLLDLGVDNSQCLRQTEINSNILAGLMDARASIVSNNLNVLMKTLNMVTIMIMVPTLVVSIFSMNVDLPFGFTEGNPFSFWVILALAVVSVASLSLIWHRRRW